MSRLRAAIQKYNTLYDLAEHNRIMINNSISKCSCGTEARWLSNAEKLICQGPLLADMLKYNFAGSNITPSWQMNGRIRQEKTKCLSSSFSSGRTVHKKSSGQNLSPLLCRFNLQSPACVGFMCLYHQVLFSWSSLTHTDVADDGVYQARSLSHPFDFSPAP